MSHISNQNSLNHRTKKRIQDLGEVFTPESYVEEMLNLLGEGKKNFWSDENIVFLNPAAAKEILSKMMVPTHLCLSTV